MAENRQPSLDPERQLIINSLFSDGVEDPVSPSLLHFFLFMLLLLLEIYIKVPSLLAHGSGTESLITYCKVSEDAGGGGNSPTTDRPFGIGKMNSRVDVKIRYLLVTSKFK
jgi:hypothetical protein